MTSFLSNSPAGAHGEGSKSDPMSTTIRGDGKSLVYIHVQYIKYVVHTCNACTYFTWYSTHCGMDAAL